VPAREKDPVKVAAGRLGGLASWAKPQDRKARTQPGRDALWQRMLDEHDGDPERADAAYREHFARLSALGRKVRAARHETPE
jgi:hypothetical protein